MQVVKHKVFGIFAATAALAVFASGCNSNTPSILGGVTFSVPPNLQTVDVALTFAQSVQTDIGGSYDVSVGGTDYGQIVVQPSTSSTPFSVGFNLNLNIVNDQNLVNFQQSTTLPTGQPIPVPNLNRAFAQVKMDKPVNSNFDVYAYVDLSGKEWLGLAVVLNFINTQYFPAGLSVAQGFDKGSDGNNQIWGAFFGPKVDANGNMLVAGGIALFANALSLIEGASSPSAGPLASVGQTFKATDHFIFQGPNAAYYQNNLKAAAALNEAMKQLLNGNSHGKKLP